MLKDLFKKFLDVLCFLFKVISCLADGADVPKGILGKIKLFNAYFCETYSYIIILF
jgi:hypothetical protein